MSGQRPNPHFPGDSPHFDPRYRDGSSGRHRRSTSIDFYGHGGGGRSQLPSPRDPYGPVHIRPGLTDLPSRRGRQPSSDFRNGRYGVIGDSNRLDPSSSWDPLERPGLGFGSHRSGSNRSRYRGGEDFDRMINDMSACLGDTHLSSGGRSGPGGRGLGGHGGRLGAARVWSRGDYGGCYSDDEEDEEDEERENDGLAAAGYPSSRPVMSGGFGRLSSPSSNGGRSPGLSRSGGLRGGSPNIPNPSYGRGNILRTHRGPRGQGASVTSRYGACSCER